MEAKLSNYLFWDVNIEKLDIKKDSGFFIERILTHGNEQDVNIMFSLYKKSKIKKVIKRMDYLNENSLGYFCFLLNMDKRRLKCYGKKPLHMK